MNSDDDVVGADALPLLLPLGMEFMRTSVVCRNDKVSMYDSNVQQRITATLIG